MIFPLYNEEIHLLGKNAILSFDDLDGKRVAIGKEGSGSYMTSRFLFEVSGITPEEILPLGPEDLSDCPPVGHQEGVLYSHHPLGNKGKDKIY